MPPTTTPEDRQMIARLGRAFANPDNATWASDYFNNPPRSDSSPTGKAAYAAHVAAVESMQAELQGEEAKARANSTVWAPVDTRPQIEAEIRQLQNDPSYMNGGRDSAAHRATMDRISYLYRQLNPE